MGNLCLCSLYTDGVVQRVRGGLAEEWEGQRSGRGMQAAYYLFYKVSI